MADPTAAQQAVVDTASSTVTIVSTDTQVFTETLRN